MPRKEATFIIMESRQTQQVPNLAGQAAAGYNAAVTGEATDRIEAGDAGERDRGWMRLALAQAAEAAALGEVPVGAVAVWSDRVIGAGFNRKETDNDPTAHAEMVALRQAAVHLNNWRLIDVTLYCTLEPCPMCAGAMIQARLPRLVYGALDVRFGADGSVLDIFDEPRFNHRVAVTRGVLADEAAALLQRFFRKLREE
jgi:tRNA(adenine34) deaminase